MGRFSRFFLWSALALLSLVLALWATQPALQAHTIEASGAHSATSLPWRFEGGPVERSLQVEFRQLLPLATRWRIIPDDELIALSVNGETVPLDDIPEASLRDWNRGFAIDLSPWLGTGQNVLELRVRNGGGPGGINLRPQTGVFGTLLLALPALLWLAALNCLLPLSRTQRVLLGLGVIVLLAYWNVTPWETRAYDVGLPDGHFGYASYIAEHLALPLPNSGWTFYHPPLYYILCAALLRLADFIGFARPESLQMLSLGFWLVFLAASCASLRLCLRGRKLWLLIATAALVFWPSGIIHSIRIGNDAPTYACCALATWCMLRWWKTRHLGSLLGMAIWGALALLCKTSAIAIVAAGGLLLAWRILFPGREGRLKALSRTALYGAITAAGLGLSLASNLYFYFKGQLSGWLVGNVGSLNGNLRVPADLKSFIPLDIPTFLSTPWANPWDDKLGRLNFWNYLLRNSLSGEFEFSGTFQLVTAYAWGICLLMICGVLCQHLARLAVHNRRALYRQRPLLLLIGMWLASLMILRIQAPYSCSNDFRYIVPVLMPIFALAAGAGSLSRLAMFAISLMSVFFFLTLQ